MQNTLTPPPCRVLIVDDSLLIREILSSILAEDPAIEVVGTAANPNIARELIKQHNPDVVTLDVEMPQMNGIEFLQKIMRLRPMPVVMISSLTQRGMDVTLQALELGAVDFVGKPLDQSADGMLELGNEIRRKVKLAAKAVVATKSAKNVRSSPLTARAFEGDVVPVIAIGASTGGVVAIRQILSEIPRGWPPILISQHMPPQFTQSFATRLNGLLPLDIMIAKDGQQLARSGVYIAGAKDDLVISKRGADYVVRNIPPQHIHQPRPSIDVMMQSVAAAAGTAAVGAVLTGMGQDGALGLAAMRSAGARTLAQNEATSTVYGMPRVAIETDAAEYAVPIDKIAQAIMDLCHRLNPQVPIVPFSQTAATEPSELTK